MPVGEDSKRMGSKEWEGWWRRVFKVTRPEGPEPIMRIRLGGEGMVAGGVWEEEREVERGTKGKGSRTTSPPGIEGNFFLLVLPSSHSTLSTLLYFTSKKAVFIFPLCS